LSVYFSYSLLFVLYLPEAPVSSTTSPPHSSSSPTPPRSSQPQWLYALITAVVVAIIIIIIIIIICLWKHKKASITYIYALSDGWEQHCGSNDLR